MFSEDGAVPAAFPLRGIAIGGFALVGLLAMWDGSPAFGQTGGLGDLARRYKMSGGYIRNAALRAAFLAAEENGALSQDHLERAVRAEFREGGKLSESGFLE